MTGIWPNTQNITWIYPHLLLIQLSYCPPPELLHCHSPARFPLSIPHFLHPSAGTSALHLVCAFGEGVCTNTTNPRSALGHYSRRWVR
uniref:Uncharacterized protein n=1 Tax=Anguilla anguilla TaxID=7936 RepID=A0A0E9WX11_ANGAN